MVHQRPQPLQQQGVAFRSAGLAPLVQLNKHQQPTPLGRLDSNNSSNHNLLRAADCLATHSSSNQQQEEGYSVARSSNLLAGVFSATRRTRISQQHPLGSLVHSSSNRRLLAVCLARPSQQVVCSDLSSNSSLSSNPSRAGCSALSLEGSLETTSRLPRISSNPLANSPSRSLRPSSRYLASRSSLSCKATRPLRAQSFPTCRRRLRRGSNRWTAGSRIRSRSVLVSELRILDRQYGRQVGMSRQRVM